MEHETKTSDTRTGAVMEMEAEGGETTGRGSPKAICSFWQGRVEIALRIMAIMVGSLPALITAIIGLILLLRSISGYAGIFIFFAALVIIIASGLAILKEVAMIILRLCNCGCVNNGINAILITAVVFSFIFSFLHLSGAALAIVSAVFLRNGALILSSLSAVFCILAAILYAVQASWSITFLVKKWNKKVDDYALRNAATNYSAIHN